MYCLTSFGTKTEKITIMTKKLSYETSDLLNIVWKKVISLGCAKTSLITNYFPFSQCSDLQLHLCKNRFPRCRITAVCMNIT